MVFLAENYFSLLFCPISAHFCLLVIFFTLVKAFHWSSGFLTNYDDTSANCGGTGLDTFFSTIVLRKSFALSG